VIIKRLGAREWRTDARRRGSRYAGHPPGGFMNALTPYAAFFMRLAVGGVFLLHGVSKFQRGILPPPRSCTTLASRSPSSSRSS